MQLLGEIGQNNRFVPPPLELAPPGKSFIRPCTILWLPIIFLPPETKLGQGYVFTRICDSVHRGGGEGVVSQHALQVSRPTLKGEVGGSDLGVGLQAHTQGWCIPACTEADNPSTATAAGGTHPTGMHSC